MEFSLEKLYSIGIGASKSTIVGTSALDSKLKITMDMMNPQLLIIQKLWKVYSLIHSKLYKEIRC